ncbi:hypothetical protein AZE42_06471 [Rhizopogon vesiculosus]|uniref:Uncharacterized protein n=1 Tax=Rhizopogon vesiculosus TaxID=180088 RepID=A0A1J8QQM7_9AGAM|nr:hypothetical protein AZE42_06471 [Rhizopogon vesiculosus]
MTSRCTGHVTTTDKLTEVVTSEGHEPSITYIPERTMNGSCDKTVWQWDLQAVDGLPLLVANAISVIPGSSNPAMKLSK